MIRRCQQIHGQVGLREIVAKMRSKHMVHTPSVQMVLDGTIIFHLFHFMSCALRARNGTSAQSSLKIYRATEEARTCEAWFQLTSRPQKWNLKAHMWHQMFPFPSSNVAICDTAPPRQHSLILHYSALLRYSVLCFNSSTQCNWYDIETMAE